MNPERWQRIEHIYNSVLERRPEERDAFLRKACAGDEDVRKEVESLLAGENQAGHFIDQRAIEVVAHALAADSPHRYIGRSLLHYSIDQEIGRGGMGVVYKARDSNLNRVVAVKLLPTVFAENRERIARFRREATLLASLSHPNIATIHSLEESEGQSFLVLELVEGETLADRLRNGPLPIAETLNVCRQIAEGLKAAHDKGIVHRDLKPGNVKITPEGKVKILDFGLAKALSDEVPPSDLLHSPTITKAMTEPGVLLGTAAYMSPEQATGKQADQRADVWAFGCVLYECLTGKRAFAGETTSETIACILRDEPDWDALPEGTPETLRRVLRGCLQKDPARRVRDLSHAWLNVEEPAALSPKPEAPISARSWMKAAIPIAATLLVLGAGIWAFLQFFKRPAPLPPTRTVALTTSGGSRPALSPDGHWVAFQWAGEKRDNEDIYVKEVDGSGFNRLTNDPANDCCPVWSPDGRQIAFVRHSGGRGILYLISPLGGGETRVAELAGAKLSWSPDGKSIAYADRKSPKDPFAIWSLSLETREKKQITTPVGNDGAPAFSPDGRYLAFIRSVDIVNTELFVMRLPSGAPSLVTAFNTPQGPSWTRDSREIVFSTQMDSGEQALWRVSAHGGEPVRVPARGEWTSQPSIGGNRLAYLSQNPNCDMWRLELTGEKPRKPPQPVLSWSSSIEVNARISPDGSRIAFCCNRSGSFEIWVCNADGANPMPLTAMKAKATGSPNWSPDGKTIAFDSMESGSIDIYTVSAEGGLVRRITTDPGEEIIPRWSRDGRSIYFGSNRTGSWQIWKTPAEGGTATQITRGGGMSAMESADGQFVYCCGALGPIRRIPVSGGSELPVLNRRISPHGWDVVDRGIFFMDWPTATICFYDSVSQSVSTLTAVHNDPGFVLDREGLGLSRDGKWLLYSGGVRASSNIMMTDNFR